LSVKVLGRGGEGEMKLLQHPLRIEEKSAKDTQGKEEFGR